MKKMPIVLTMAVLAAAASWAEGHAVTVQNQESSTFWYVLDPAGFSDEEPGSPWLTLKAADYLATEGEDFPFSALAPGEKATFDGLAEGTHYLLGFFDDDSLEDLPVRLVTMQADSAIEVRHYDVYRTPELMSAARGEGMLARFARVEEAVPVAGESAEEAADQGTGVVEEASVEEAAVEDTVVEEAAAEDEIAVEEPARAAEDAPDEEPAAVEALATFAESYDPVYFTRESREGFIVLPIATSEAWGKPGTRLASFSALLAEGAITLGLQSSAGFSPNVSCFLYVFPTRTAGGPSEYTFEARPDADGRAAVVLWQKGRTVPRLVGTARTDDGEFIWTARVDELPPELTRALGPAATLDLTTAWLDETSGTWEEFYFTTFAVADLTR